MKKWMILGSLLIVSFPGEGKSEWHEVRKVKLSQVDYRRRLSISLKIPGITRFRIRPSLEYRYKVRKSFVR
jgi:hypothetical protein